MQIEYDLLNSTKDHLEVLDIHRTDQEAIPKCMVWYPPLTRESFLLICNSVYKVKLFNSTTKMCRYQEGPQRDSAFLGGPSQPQCLGEAGLLVPLHAAAESRADFSVWEELEPF